MLETYPNNHSTMIDAADPPTFANQIFNVINPQFCSPTFPFTLFPFHPSISTQFWSKYNNLNNFGDDN